MRKASDVSVCVRAWRYSMGQRQSLAWSGRAEHAEIMLLQLTRLSNPDFVRLGDIAIVVQSAAQTSPLLDC